MTFNIFIFLNTLIISEIATNYIIIPFDTFIYNPKNNIILQNDILSMKLYEDIYSNISMASPAQNIKTLLRLDKYEITIKEPKYNSSLSNSFKLKSIQDKLIGNESFYFLTIDSLEELNKFIKDEGMSTKNIDKNFYKEYKDIKFVYINETSNYKFLEKELNDREIEKIIAYNYSMLGLRLRFMYSDYYPDFIQSLREMKIINSSIFTFYINNNKKENDHYGYLIIGDKFTDTEKEFEETNSTFFSLRGSSLSWDIRIDNIYSEAKSNSKFNEIYLEKNQEVELIIEKSYILGTKNYKSFIENAFFNELIGYNICQYKNSLMEHSYGTYVCDSTSKIFLDFYNNKFPELIFKTGRITDELILNKNDLFFYNKYNKSDTNIYFMIFFSTIYTSKWMLSRAFLEKYRLSFNLDTRFIEYHKKKFSENKIENETKEDDRNNDNIYLIIKIVAIIFLVSIIFLLGFLFHKLITRKPRKQKANELNDDFDYSSINKS